MFSDVDLLHTKDTALIETASRLAAKASQWPLIWTSVRFHESSQKARHEANSMTGLQHVEGLVLCRFVKNWVICVGSDVVQRTFAIYLRIG